ncbi:discoidin domain-containing protein [Lysinibacillus sphaericus]|uniref:discoidin domain-containing protein n=1 Tax=Lysinibacillus sphaericus TaxID=1421 RepID=UPI001CBE12F6|nr:discoidin domain-containing protein [Lysinibacillus sphaericus]
MATTSIPSNVRRKAKFNYISTNYICSVNGNGVSLTPDRLYEILHDGITSKQGTYGALLLVGSALSYIEFSVKEDCRFWATSGIYNDSGGSSGNVLDIYKYDSDIKSYSLYKSVSTTTKEDWYVVCELLTIGTYKIQAKGNYVQFNEFYFESLVENKSFILHDSVYKRFNTTIPSDGGKKLVPIMNKTTQDGITISQSSSDGSSYGYLAFSQSSAWLSYSGASVSNPEWIMIDFGEGNKKLVTSYEARAVTSHAYITKHKFQGSNNGVDFVDLFESTESMTTTIKKYGFINETEYRYYRIYAYGSSGGNGRASLMNVQLFQKPTPMIRSYWSTVSTNLPTSTQFLEQGMDNLSSIDRTVTELEPLPMTDKSEILTEGEVGKVFSTTIDLKKIFDIRSIRTEVK